MNEKRKKDLAWEMSGAIKNIQIAQMDIICNEGHPDYLMEKLLRAQFSLNYILSVVKVEQEKLYAEENKDE